ncbi:MAG: glucosamine-6-phosphate isomerase [Clostridia bacterium]|nr:glucosamine-6-phosphate isomerase [Clostridia bacterium]
MTNTYTCSSEEFMQNKRMPVRIMETEQSMYEEIAQIMVDTIKEKNAKGEKTLIICPVGPIMQYPVFAKKVNEEKVSLKNVWFVNMDEYLDENEELIDRSSILSFRSTMDRLCYSQIDPELVMPESQRLFPVPGKEAEIDALIEEMGADLCLTGVGINGHIAFNEPPEADDPITDEGYENISTRCLDISRETITNNGANKICGALDVFPKRCVTLGMKQLLSAKKFKIYLYCNWQWGIMRKVALEAPTRTAPATFLQNHPDAEMVITRDLYEKKVF